MNTIQVFIAGAGSAFALNAVISFICARMDRTIREAELDAAYNNGHAAGYEKCHGEHVAPLHAHITSLKARLAMRDEHNRIVVQKATRDALAVKI